MQIISLIYIVGWFVVAKTLPQVNECRIKPEFREASYRGTFSLFKKGDAVSVHCKKTYQEQESKTTCLGNDKWSNPEPNCQVARCKQPPSLVHGSFSPKQQHYEYGELIKVQCNRGFRSDGDTNMSCWNHGKWKGTFGNCTAVSCKHLDVLPEITLTPPCSPCPYGTIVNGSCPNGYYYNGTALKCSDTGSWNGTTGQCVPKLCTGSPEADNGSFNVSSRFLGSEAKLICNEGYEPKGKDMIVCGENGEWSTSGGCQPLTKSEGTLSSATVIVPVCSIVLVLVLLAGVFIWKKRRHKKERGGLNGELSESKGLLELTEFKQDTTRGGETDHVKLKMVESSNINWMALNKYKIERNAYQDYLEQKTLQEIAIDDMNKASLILITGRAGAGLTTLLHSIMLRWNCLMISTRNLVKERGSPLERVTLREFFETHAVHGTDVEDWWRPGNSNERKLICIDGEKNLNYFLDRTKLSPALTESSIAGPAEWCTSILKKEVLHQCKLIVTSRPFRGLDHLRPDRKISVVGLTTAKNVKEFIRRHVRDESKETIENTILTDPVMLSLSTITLFCKVLCDELDGNAGCVDDESNICSHTRMVSFVFKKLITRNIQHIDADDSMIVSCISKFSKLAFLGLEKNNFNTDNVQILFSDEDLAVSHIEEQDVDTGIGLGLIISHDAANAGGDDTNSIFTEFIHVSLQDILSMVYLLNQDEQIIERTLRRISKSSSATHVLPYLFGLRYDSQHNVQELLKWTYERCSRDRLPEIKEIVYKLLKQVKGPNRYQRLRAITMAYESRRRDIASEVVNLVCEGDTIIFGDMSLTAVDLKAIVRAINSSARNLKLWLRRIADGSTCLENLGSILAKDKNIETLMFTDTEVSEQSLKHFLRSLEKNSTLHSLNLDGTSLNDTKMKVLADFLVKNSSIKTLSLKHNDVLREGMIYFADAVKKNKILHTLKFDSKMAESTLEVLRRISKLNIQVITGESTMI